MHPPTHERHEARHEARREGGRRGKEADAAAETTTAPTGDRDRLACVSGCVQAPDARMVPSAGNGCDCRHTPLLSLSLFHALIHRRRCSSGFLVNFSTAANIPFPLSLSVFPFFFGLCSAGCMLKLLQRNICSDSSSQRLTGPSLSHSLTLHSCLILIIFVRKTNFASAAASAYE